MDLIDPTPDIHELFVQFSHLYFFNKLQAVFVEWSNRMTSCAGLCYYHRRSGMCTIRLSEPLLKFRPRSDLINTLLHEMIHAFLFVTNGNRDHDAHGPPFVAHMRRVNSAAGTSISVYHNFYDEVNHYKVHVWKCNGPCADRPPYYGLVKRSMNRKPQPADFWWADHQKSCGGTFVKISKDTKGKKLGSSPNSTIPQLFARIGSSIPNRDEDDSDEVCEIVGESGPLKTFRKIEPSKRKVELLSDSESTGTEHLKKQQKGKEKQNEQTPPPSNKSKRTTQGRKLGDKPLGLPPLHLR